MRTSIVRALRAATAASLAFTALGAAAAGTADAASTTPQAGSARPVIAYVVNEGSGTVTPIRTATNKAGQAITVGKDPAAIAITPNGTTAYVVNEGSGTVTPIRTATNKAGQAITVGKRPRYIAITPSGTTAYVVNGGSATVTPIQTATNTVGKAITVGGYPVNIAITPNGKIAYVANYGCSCVPSPGTVTPIQTATNTAGKAITVGGYPGAIAITPDGKTAYVVIGGIVGAAPGLVVPIQTATDTAGKAITVEKWPYAIAITPNGRTAYVATSSGTVTPIQTATNTAGKAIKGVAGPVAITPNGTTAYAASYGSGTVTPIRTATNEPGKAITVGSDPIAIAIMPAAAVPAGFEPVSASFYSPASGFVLGGAGCRSIQVCQARLVATTDTGARWHYLNAPDVRLSDPAGASLASAVSGVVFASPRDGWLYGPGLWSTRDGGVHWRRLSLGGGIESMAASAGTVYAVVSPPAGKPSELFRSPANRDAWVRVGTMTAAQAILAVSGRAAWFANATAGPDGGSTYVWATADGVRWHRYPFRCPATGHGPDRITYGLSSIAAASPSQVELLCTGGDSMHFSDKELLTSRDSGRTVHLGGRPPTFGIGGMIAVPPHRPDVISLATEYGVDHSSDGGETWNQVLFNSWGGSLTSLSYVSTTVGWAVLPQGVKSQLVRTSDAGATWHQVRF